MKKLRIISLYKLIIITLIITLIISFFRIKNNNIEKYKDEITMTGIITDIKKYDDYAKIELNAKEKVLVTINDKIDFKLGEKIKITGPLQIPSNNTIFNLFNYKKYLLSKKIKYTITPNSIEKIDDTKKIKYKIKNKIIEHISTYKSKNYLSTFILGENNQIEAEINTSYQKNGISHLFAVSGMHLSLFSIIIAFILKKIKVKERGITIITILVFIFFAFLTNYSPSILRALLMYTFLSINKILNFKIKSIYILLLVLEILLLYNPFYVYNTGFLFSFTVSFFLITYNSIINSKKNYFSKVLITSMIAHLSSIPIQINSFFEINILSPIINVIFVPFVSFIVFPMALITLFIKPLDNIFCFLIKILEKTSMFTKNISITLTLSSIKWYVIIIYYTFIVMFIQGFKNKKIIFFLPLIVLILIHYSIKYFIKENKITYLDVGQGDSILIEQKENNNILIDTGGNVLSHKDIVKNKTIPYLKSIGIKKINYLILTHGDYDHMGEAINLVNNFKVEKVIFNCGEYNDLEKELIKVLDKKNIKYYSCISELNIDKNKLYFLQTRVYDNENDNSNVIYTELDGYKFMFMGDASTTTEKEILSKYNLPDIDVLKVGHHGSRTSSGKDFINEINPKYSIISVGKNNRYGHPNKEVLDNLNESKIYRTDKQGSIMFKIKNNQLKIETCSP